MVSLSYLMFSLSVDICLPFDSHQLRIDVILPGLLNVRKVLF